MCRELRWSNSQRRSRRRSEPKQRSRAGAQWRIRRLAHLIETFPSVLSRNSEPTSPDATRRRKLSPSKLAGQSQHLHLARSMTPPPANATWAFYNASDLILSLSLWSVASYFLRLELRLQRRGQPFSLKWLPLCQMEEAVWFDSRCLRRALWSFRWEISPSGPLVLPPLRLYLPRWLPSTVVFIFSLPNFPENVEIFLYLFCFMSFWSMISVALNK